MITETQAGLKTKITPHVMLKDGMALCVYFFAPTSSELAALNIDTESRRLIKKKFRCIFFYDEEINIFVSGGGGESVTRLILRVSRTGPG